MITGDEGIDFQEYITLMKQQMAVATTEDELRKAFRVHMNTV
jgi:Ca2+-binding EF-hand superfamily protein